jgi:hypothetical protein
LKRIPSSVWEFSAGIGKPERVYPYTIENKHFTSDDEDSTIFDNDELI